MKSLNEINFKRKIHRKKWVIGGVAYPIIRNPITLFREFSTKTWYHTNPAGPIGRNHELISASLYQVKNLWLLCISELRT